MHGFLPNSLLLANCLPIIKDKCGKINTQDNYRPIALPSIVFKRFENILLENVGCSFYYMQSVWR